MKEQRTCERHIDVDYGNGDVRDEPCGVPLVEDSCRALVPSGRAEDGPHALSCGAYRKSSAHTRSRAGGFMLVYGHDYDGYVCEHGHRS